MNSELDQVKSTITISLGTKNRLRELKGSKSYEDYINYLLRTCLSKEVKEENYLEMQKFERVKATYSLGEYKIIYSYNKHNSSQNYIFDINIEYVTKKGANIEFSQLLEELSPMSNKTPLQSEYQVYFTILTIIITSEIESVFKHKGRFEDYHLWKEEFKTLDLPDKSFEEDVMQKLENYQRGYHYND